MFRGWVYIEAKMNDELSKLLKSTPGLVHRYPDVSRNQIDFRDWTKVLTMTDSSHDLSVGSWVRVHSGLYKGDIGFLAGIETWGGVSVLLIPRLHPHNQHKSSGKRKRPSARPPPTLFHPDTAAQTYSVRPVYRNDGCYHFLNSRFQHGLIYKKYNHHSVSPTSEIMLDAFQLFRDSNHPELMAPPRPVEWIFKEEEKVVVTSTQKQGIISRVQALSAEVDFHDGEGLASIPWFDLHKVFQIGDFVEIMKGSESRTQGWVTTIEGKWIEVLGDSPLQHTLDQSDQTTTVRKMLH